MGDSVAGVVLAAGGGTRLVPLSLERPKALCPVGGLALVDRALAAVGAVTADRAVNAHHGATDVSAHIHRRYGDAVHISREEVLLGTGGALGALREWIDGRPVVVVNADTVHTADLGALVEGWDGERIRFLLAERPGTPFGPGVRLYGVLMPSRALQSLEAVPCGVYEQIWAPWAALGRVEAVGVSAEWFDCGTPASYLAANLWLSEGKSVIGDDASVEGEVERTVVWDGASVSPAERLVDAIRTTAGRTVLVRWREG